jgi:hypothetical protein
VRRARQRLRRQDRRWVRLRLPREDHRGVRGVPDQRQCLREAQCVCGKRECQQLRRARQRLRRDQRRVLRLQLPRQDHRAVPERKHQGSGRGLPGLPGARDLRRGGPVRRSRQQLRRETERRLRLQLPRLVARGLRGRREDGVRGLHRPARDLPGDDPIRDLRPPRQRL